MAGFDPPVLQILTDVSTYRILHCGEIGQRDDTCTPPSAQTRECDKKHRSRLLAQQQGSCSVGTPSILQVRSSVAAHMLTVKVISPDVRSCDSCMYKDCICFLVFETRCCSKKLGHQVPFTAHSRIAIDLMLMFGKDVDERKNFGWGPELSCRDRTKLHCWLFERKSSIQAFKR